MPSIQLQRSTFYKLCFGERSCIGIAREFLGETLTPFYLLDLFSRITGLVPGPSTDAGPFDSGPKG
jgi:hypothetical protein